MPLSNYKCICPFTSIEDLASDMQKIIRNVLINVNEYKEFDYRKLEGILEILRIWKENKSHILFSEIFSGSMIVELEEVSIRLSDEQKQKFAKDFICNLKENWEDMFPEFPEYNTSGYNLGCFLTLNANGFFQNKTTHTYNAPDGTFIDLDCKISKHFKHFFDDEELIRQLQDKYSEYIQKDRLTGTLCASIHPLDFLSSSENNYNWRSCHALNGDYCGGNMSYIMDNCSIIFYIRGKEKTHLPRFPEDVLWNDKKWRMLVCYSAEIIGAGRQYPFMSEELLEPIRKFLGYLANFEMRDPEYFPCWYHDYTDFIGMPTDEGFDHKLLVYPHLYYKGVMLTKYHLVRSVKFTANYNDFLYSSCYEPYFAFYKNYTIHLDELKPMEIGHVPICACCGQVKSSMGNDEFVCNDCIEVVNPVFCADCGQQMKSSQGEWVKSLGYVCSNCFQKYSWLCPDCNTRISNDHKTCWQCELNTLFAQQFSTENAATIEIPF